MSRIDAGLGFILDELRNNLDFWKSVLPPLPIEEESFDVEWIEIVQVRKHKKKRINKKWLKKYGVKQITRTSKGWKITNYADAYNLIEEKIKDLLTTCD